MKKTLMVENMESAIADVKQMEKDLVRLDMYESSEANTRRYNEINARLKKLKGNMNTTNRHNIQQQRKCVVWLDHLTPLDADFIIATERKEFLKHEITIYRKWLRGENK